MCLLGRFMNFAAMFNFVIATVLIVIYLTLPIAVCAQISALESGAPDVQVNNNVTSTASGDVCPCADETGSSCCDTTCCCACHAPLGKVFRLAYAPVLASHVFSEPLRFFPLVYQAIYVPPQNFV